MTADKILYCIEVNSCETCPGRIKELYGVYRCSHNTEITFQQNRDMGIPAACPKRTGT
jgi:hypothetical protein